jgi:hypothetical protein
VQSVATATVTIDRDISSLGAAGAATFWRPLAPGNQIGTRAATPETNPVLTYAPDSAGTAPASGFVWVDGAGTAVRVVTSRAYDAVVMSQPRPDADLSNYSVDRYTKRPPSASGFITVASQSLAMNAAPPPNVLAYQRSPRARQLPPQPLFRLPPVRRPRRSTWTRPDPLRCRRGKS